MRDLGFISFHFKYRIVKNKKKFRIDNEQNILH